MNINFRGLTRFKENVGLFTVLGVTNIQFCRFLVFHYLLRADLVIVVESNKGKHVDFVHFVRDLDALVLNQLGVIRVLGATVAEFLRICVY